ncbi:MAG: hypothetical protein C0507_14330 [Cyanobacteria bacterium PR.3.49]|nr:hypothetical protein [Cyanobacteria bacterium PR.3.49]
MKTPTRPAGVPSEAVWVEKDQEWQLGKHERRGVIKKVEVPVGEWRYWRKDGSLCCIATLDSEGRPDGIVERFHNDGTLAYRGEWKQGNRRGHFVHYQCENQTDEEYPAHSKTWRYEFDSTANWSEENSRWFLKDGTECTSDGRDLANAFDLDTAIGACEPENFLAENAAKIAALMPREDGEGVEPLAEAKTDPFNLKEIWGVTCPEIDRFLSFAVEDSTFSPCTSTRPFDGNIWEAIIAHPWENQCEDLGAVFLGAVQIGFFGDSDHVYATIFQPRREESEPNAVFLWSHDTYYVDEVLSKSLDEFGYRVAVSAAFERERLSKNAARKAWKKLEGKCNVGWSASSGLETVTQDDSEEDESESGNVKARYQVELDEKFTVTGHFWRAQWIVELLNYDSRRNWSDIKECFRPSWNKSLDKVYESLKTSGNERLPHTALYLLWRLFWFKQETELKECCDLYRNHPARIVRDLVVLLEEIGNGRKEIGQIKDIYAVREEFLKLDLQPEREEERKEEKAQNKAAESTRLESVSAEALKLAQAGPEAILEKAWDSVTDVNAMAELEKAARTIPNSEIKWRCFDWVRDGGYRRDNIDVTEEVVDIGIWLGQNNCDILQPFLWSSIYLDHSNRADLLLPAIGKTTGALDQRLAKCCLNQLDIEEEYNFKRSLAVKLLRVMGEKSAVPRLCRLIDEYFEVIGSKKDFDARLASIPWEELLIETSLALADFADLEEKKNRPVATKSLKMLLEHAIKEHEQRVSPHVLNALVAWGETDLLPQIGRMLRENDTDIQVAALRAIETIAPKLDAKKLKAFVAIEFYNPADNDNSVTLMYYRAANALLVANPSIGETETLSKALAEARQLDTYGSDLWHKWRLLECETVGKFPELELESIADYLKSSNTEIREAAEAAFTARGAEFSQTMSAKWPHVWSAVEYADKSPMGAHIAVAELLLDDSIVNHTAPAAWLWENPSATTAKAVCEIVKRQLSALPKIQSGEYLPSNHLWVLRALAKHSEFSECRDLVIECLNDERQEVAAALVSDLESMPLSFAEPLLKLAAEHDGWQKYTIAKWAINNKEKAEITAALKSTGITIKQLKSWVS